MYGKGKSKRVYATKKYVKQHLQQALETKYHDLEIPATSISSVGSIQSISGMIKGTSVDQRIGDTIRIHKLSFQLAGIRAVGDSFNTMRLIFFQWNVDSTTDVPTLLEILEPDSGAGSGILAPYRNYKFDTLKQRKMRILYDSLMTVDEVKADTHIWRRKSITFKNPIKVVFNQEALTPTGYGKIYYMIVSDSTGSFHPTLRGFTRVEYKDA